MEGVPRGVVPSGSAPQQTWSVRRDGRVPDTLGPERNLGLVVLGGASSPSDLGTRLHFWNLRFPRANFL